MNTAFKGVKMLFQIQDFDRPAYVIADNYHEAITKWQHALYSESPDDYKNIDDVALPNGINLICIDDEIIVTDIFYSEENDDAK